MAVKKCAIMLDEWKLPIFEQHLRAAGHTIQKVRPLMPGVLSMVVHTTDINALAATLKAAAKECERGVLLA